MNLTFTPWNYYLTGILEKFATRRPHLFRRYKQMHAQFLNVILFLVITVRKRVRWREIISVLYYRK